VSADAPQSNGESRVRTMQIINGAIVGGAVVALAVLSVLRTQNPLPQPDPPLVSYILLGVAAASAAAALVVPAQMAAAARRRLAAPGAPPDSGAWYAQYQTCLITRLAQLEGPALALAIAWFLEGWPPALVAAVVLIVLMLLQFPTVSRVERWIEAQRELAYQDRAPP
jgi:hypothetical protein